jgi:hypothetical protein
MSAPGPSKIEKLRAQHGDDCWWCFKPLDFRADARKTQRPTFEHLQPKSLGGTNELGNLRLCHPGCNKELGNRSRVEKERLRQRRLRRSQKIDTVAAPIFHRHEVPEAPPSVPVVDRWKILTLMASAAALFLAGLSVGLLIANG